MPASLRAGASPSSSASSLLSSPTDIQAAEFDYSVEREREGVASTYANEGRKKFIIEIISQT